MTVFILATTIDDNADKEDESNSIKNQRLLCRYFISGDDELRDAYEEFGRGFDERNLRNRWQFLETFQNWNAVRSELSWTHYRLLMRVKESEKREDYIVV